MLNNWVTGKTYFWVLSLFTVTFLVRSPVFVYPFFNGDEATYTAIANSILDGNLLYVSIVDHKPPLIYLTYAVLLKFLGNYSIAAIQSVSILAVAVTALALQGVCSAAGRSPAEARFAALAYVIFTAMGPGKDMLAANAEIFMMLATAIGVWSFLLKRSVAYLALAGFFCGVAFLYKYQGGAILAALCFTLLAERKSSWGRRVAWQIPLGLGFLAPVLLLCFHYGRTGHIEELYFWGWVFPMKYAGMLSGEEIAYNALVQNLQWIPPNIVLLLGAVAGIRVLVQERESEYAALLFFWCVWAVLGVASGGRFTLHYYIQLLPALSLMAAVCFSTYSTGITHEITEKRRASRVVLFAGVLTALPLFLFFTANMLDHRLRPRIPRALGAYQEIGTWIKENSSPEEQVLVWGNSAEIYYYSQRTAGTRFVFCNYHSGKIWGTAFDEEGAEGTEAMAVEPAWKMLLADIRIRRPQWIVDAASAGLDRWQGHELSRYARLWELVSSQYEIAGTVAGATLYRWRKEP